MRRILTLVVGGLGLGALLRRRRRRRVDVLDEDPAEELRARLAETKSGAGEADEPVDEEAAGEPERSPLDPDSRRHEVHERTRRAIDDLRSPRSR